MDADSVLVESGGRPLSTIDIPCRAIIKTDREDKSEGANLYLGVLLYASHGRLHLTTPSYWRND